MPAAAPAVHGVAAWSSAILAVPELGSYASSVRGWRLRAARDPGTQGSRQGPATASGARASRLPKLPIPPFLTLQVQSRAEEIYGGWYKHGTRTALPQTIAAAAILSASREMAAALRETMGVELTMANLTRVAGVAEGTILCRRQGGSDLGQLAHRRRLSTPAHASGCPNPASLGRSAAWAALAGHVGRVFDLGTIMKMLKVVPPPSTPSALGGTAASSCAGKSAIKTER